MRLVRAAFVIGTWLLAGCAEDVSSIELSNETDMFGATDGDRDGGRVVAECDGAAQGTPCGDPGDRTHCIFDACIRNACGDGVPAGGEECDDGDELDGDGCSARCHMEVAPGCGNEVLEPGEECDDGNTASGDRCEATCTLPVTTGDGDGDVGDGDGDGIIDVGDGDGDGDGDQVVDAGDGDGDGDADAGVLSPTCTPCRDTYCRDYEGSGIDLVAGCFEAIQAGNDIPEPDPLFVQHCTEAVSCAFTNDCGYNLARGPVECYCGSRSTDDCQAMGPGPDAQCVQEWTDATRGTSNASILDLFSEFSRPSGWAFYVLTCDATNCDDAAAGDCTP